MTESRVFAVDVGVKHLSCALLRFPRVDEDVAVSPLESATSLLRASTLEEWSVEALTAPSFAEVLEAAVRFVERRRDALRRCDAIVIEQQMAPKMRCVAAALFGAARSLAPDAKVLFQPASSKLDWHETVYAALAPGARTDSYGRRKTAAVRLCGGLLAAAGQQAAAAQLAAGRKKDDLADALLHGLRFAAAASRPPRRAAKRPRAPSSAPGRNEGSSSFRSRAGTPRPAAASAPA